MPIINQVVAGGGITPSGTLTIVNNGQYNVTNYATADVQVPTTAPTMYRAFEISDNGTIIPSTTCSYLMDFTGVVSIADSWLNSAYLNNTIITGIVSMPNLKRITGYIACSNMFYNCSGITGADFPLLETCGGANNCCGSMFYHTGITFANMPHLVSVSNNGCFNQIFAGTKLQNMVFYSLKTCQVGATLLNNMFSGCGQFSYVKFCALTPSSFGTRTDQFNGMLSGCTGVTVHFPSNIQTTIGSWSSVVGGFGGTNTTVLFDLPSTAHLIGANNVEYERNPVDDTPTALAWRLKDSGGIVWTSYYTSGTTDPQVNDTIYSDTSCTTAVTTVDSIA